MRLITPEPFLFVWMAISLALVYIWYKALREIVQSKFEGTNEKLLWIVLVIFMPFIGTFLYFSIGRKSRLTDNHE